MPELTSLEDLGLSLKDRPGRIGIDGRNGTRKSTIADLLSQQMGIDSVHIDDFLIKEQGGYVEFVDYPKLTDTLQSKPRAIVEGVCLIQVLERAKMRVDTLVYVKRYHLGLWGDERELDVPLAEVEAFIRKEREFAAILSGEPEDEGPSMHDDIVRYHSAYQPHLRAQLVYRWDDV